MGPSVLQDQKVRRRGRGLPVCKYPTPRHDFLRLFPLSSLTQLSMLESNRPGPFDKKSFLALLPRRPLSPQAAVSERKMTGPRRRLGAPTPTSATRVPWSRPLRQKDPLLCSQMALFWSLGFLSESSGRHGLPPPPPTRARNTHSPSIISRGHRIRHLGIRRRKVCLALPSPGPEFRPQSLSSVRSPSWAWDFPHLQIFLPFGRSGEEVGVGEKDRRPGTVACGAWA